MAPIVEASEGAALSMLTWTWLPVWLVSAARQDETFSWQAPSHFPSRHSGPRPSAPLNFNVAPSGPAGASSSWSSRSAQRAVYFQSIACCGVISRGAGLPSTERSAVSAFDVAAPARVATVVSKRPTRRLELVSMTASSVLPRSNVYLVPVEMVVASDRAGSIPLSVQIAA